MASVLREIRDNEPIAFYDLVERCRNPLHRMVKSPHHDSERVLRSYKVLKDDGSITPMVRMTIGACIRGKYPNYTYRGILDTPGIFKSRL